MGTLDSRFPDGYISDSSLADVGNLDSRFPNEITVLNGPSLHSPFYLG